MRLATQRYRPMSMPASTGDLLLGGDERTRTADPLLAKQVLYQLSYVPLLSCDDGNTLLGTAVPELLTDEPSS
jgi:hypothetical protein